MWSPCRCVKCTACRRSGSNRNLFKAIKPVAPKSTAYAPLSSSISQQVCPRPAEKNASADPSAVSLISAPSPAVSRPRSAVSSGSRAAAVRDRAAGLQHCLEPLAARGPAQVKRSPLDRGVLDARKRDRQPSHDERRGRAEEVDVEGADQRRGQTVSVGGPLTQTQLDDALAVGQRLRSEDPPRPRPD